MEFPADGRVLGLILKIYNRGNIRISDLAEELNLSTRTIRNYIKNINEALPSVIAQVVSLKGAEVELCIYDHEKYDELMKRMKEQFTEQEMIITPEERIKYVAKILLYSKDPINMDELSESMFIGRTTLVNDIKKLGNALTTYNMYIKGKPNTGVWLEGSEIAKRQFIIEVLSRGYYNMIGLNNIIKEDEPGLEIVFKEVDKVFKESNIMHLDETTKLTRKYIMVLADRIKKGFDVVDSEKKYEVLSTTEEYKIAEVIFKLIGKKLDINLKEAEKYYLTLPLIARNASIKIDSNNIEISNSIKNLVVRILDEISNTMGIQIKYDKELMAGLEYHINFAVNRLVFNINTENPMIYDIKRKYSFPYEMAKVAAKVIERTYSVKVTEEETAFLALHFGSYVEKINTENDDINRVALICSTGLGTAKLLFIRLRNLLGNDKIINTFSENEIDLEELDTYDMIFTTIPLKIETTTPIIKLDIFFEEDELRKRIKNRFVMSKNTAWEVGSNVSIVNMATKPNLFFKTNLDDYIDILKEIIGKLFNQREVDEGYLDRVLDREATYPTTFANGVAMPHAINKGGERLMIAIIIPEKEVNYENSDVRIIFMLLIPEIMDESPEVLIKTYEEILKICQNEDLLGKVINAKDYFELTNVLVKEALK